MHKRKLLLAIVIAIVWKKGANLNITPLTLRTNKPTSQPSWFFTLNLAYPPNPKWPKVDTLTQIRNLQIFLPHEVGSVSHHTVITKCTCGEVVAELLKRVSDDGYHPETSWLCSEDYLKNVMLSCWQSPSKLRPDFNYLNHQLKPLRAIM